MKLTIKLLVIDVDGTMTDGSIYYDEKGNELKKFNTKDAAGFFVAKKAGIKTMVITGRECEATKRRMLELGVDYLDQNVKNKEKYLNNFMKKNGYCMKEVAYIGDDLNDISAMKLCGYKACPMDGCNEVKSISDYVSIMPGGHGAVRDIIEHMFCETGEWSNYISEVYGIGI